MEENEIFVVVDEVALDAEQYDELRTELQQVNTNLHTVNASIVHATMFLVLLCVFQCYALLSRARKKGGV